MDARVSAITLVTLAPLVPGCAIHLDEDENGFPEFNWRDASATPTHHSQDLQDHLMPPARSCVMAGDSTAVLLGAAFNLAASLLSTLPTVGHVAAAQDPLEWLELDVKDKLKYTVHCDPPPPIEESAFDSLMLFTPIISATLGFSL